MGAEDRCTGTCYQIMLIANPRLTCSSPNSSVSNVVTEMMESDAGNVALTRSSPMMRNSTPHTSSIADQITTAWMSSPTSSKKTT